MDNPLKPCPFCGSEKARIVWSPGPAIRITGIFCYGCKAAVIWPFKDTTVGKETIGQMQQPWIEMYNRRAEEGKNAMTDKGMTDQRTYIATATARDGTTEHNSGTLREMIDWIEDRITNAAADDAELFLAS